jgi:hypothetical protein
MKKKIIYSIAFALLLFSCNQEKDSENGNTEKVAEKSFSQTVNNGNVNFDKYFEDKTMRFDYFHTGTSSEEHFSPDEFLSDGIWPGSKTKLIDELELGLYFFEILDSESNTLLYSRGFASIFGEWQTIPEAAEQWELFMSQFGFHGLKSLLKF